MATQALQPIDIDTPSDRFGAGRVHAFTWATMGQNDDGEYLVIGPTCTDLTIHAADGDVFGGGTLGLQASNDGGGNWVDLPGSDNTTIAIDGSTEFINQPLMLGAYVRPKITGGDGTTAIHPRVSFRTSKG